MKERPILMTPANAQKCHDGTKTQTRRIVKGLHSVDFYPQITKPGIATFLNRELANPYDDAHDVTCHYGVPGDRLWVREPFATTSDDGKWIYKGWSMFDGMKTFDWKWTPSIHMPRLACRTVLEITEIRVQRLQEISENDAKAEGCMVPTVMHADSDQSAYSYVENFKLLWGSINGAGSWAENPWVWAITFKKVTS